MRMYINVVYDQNGFKLVLVHSKVDAVMLRDCYVWLLELWW